MDFFASQEHAEKQTRLMLLMFVVAVIGVVLSINVAGALIFMFYADVRAATVTQAFLTVPHALYWLISIVVLGAIATGSLGRISGLSGGGAAVAELVGARPVKPDGSDPAEQRLINVVEEMSIASGIRMPLVYVMDDQRGINAFAAGYSADEAAVTVTRGALERLNRDELQGVVAHEFSHILNGDMRLNVRLIGVIAGIVVIGGMGRFMMNLGRDNRKGDIRLLTLGVILWLIGSVGVFFGTFIKAAISRQREYLADASAVQFTRNPEGIAGALYKISLNGSKVNQRYADELSHMYFSEAMDDLFATHPPMEDRIQRIMGPRGIALLRDRIKKLEIDDSANLKSPLVDSLNSPIPANPGADGVVQFADYSKSAEAGTGTVRMSPGALMSSVGTLTQAHIDHAQRILGQLPAEVRRAVTTGAGAKAALLSLALGRDEVRAQQLAHVSKNSSQMLADAIERLAGLIHPLGIAARMPVFDLSLPALRNLDEVERDETITLMEAMISADGKVSLEEFVLLTVTRSQMKPAASESRVRHRTIQSVSNEATTILTLLTRAGNCSDEACVRVFTGLGLTALASNSMRSISFQAVEAALREIKALAPRAKAMFIKGCSDIVAADGQISIIEGELMRAICAALEVPLPPILEPLTEAM